VSDPDAVLAVVHEHLAAFNAADLDRVMATFAEDASFTTAEQMLVGRRGIAELFAQAFAPGVNATMQLQQAVVQGDTVACELRETISFEGNDAEFGIAAFYTVRDHHLVRVKVYRDQLE